MDDSLLKLIIHAIAPDDARADRQPCARYGTPGEAILKSQSLTRGGRHSGRVVHLVFTTRTPKEAALLKFH
jgi:hypothetical protein